MSKQVLDYIENNWDKCIRENREDNDTLIGLPYPYTIPAVGLFNELYYWDTYFTNKGLELCGRAQLAKSNTDNMLYLVKKYGFMPNGNRTYYLTRSQPPFLSEMVRDVYNHYKDKAWLCGAYETLKCEYDFWMTRRATPIGLNQYGGDADEKALIDAGKGFEERTGIKTNADFKSIGSNCVLTCESGWDMNPRWGTEGYNFAHIDLNSLMYMFEINMAYFSEELNKGEEKEWKAKSEGRREKMLKYMTDDNGLFFDYNFKNDKLGNIFSVASLYPLFASLATKENAKAAVDNLYRLEAEHGILVCEKNDIKGTYQWNYPNGWACLQYVAIKAFDNYGYTDIALRLAEKYVRLVEKCFDETGNLWEKYNVVTGEVSTANEYKTPTMLGWSAGVYLYTSSFKF